MIALLISVCSGMLLGVSSDEVCDRESRWRVYDCLEAGRSLVLLVSDYRRLQAAYLSVRILGLELPHTVYRSASSAPLMSSTSAWVISALP